MPSPRVITWFKRHTEPRILREPGDTDDANSKLCFLVSLFRVEFSGREPLDGTRTPLNDRFKRLATECVADQIRYVLADGERRRRSWRWSVEHVDCVVRGNDLEVVE